MFGKGADDTIMIRQYYNLTIEQTQELTEKLKNYNEYVPLILLPLTPTDYFEKISDETNKKIFIKRNKQPNNNKRKEYLKQDFEEWLKNNKEFQEIIQ